MALVLVVGATGALGAGVAALLQSRGHAVRLLVRKSPEAVGSYPAGAELCEGNLADIASLKVACAGVTAIVCSASAMRSSNPGDTLASVDLDGQLALVRASIDARVERFVFISFPPLLPDSPLQRAKRTVERALAESPLAFTALQPANFCETWFGPRAGFDAAQGTVRVLGDGNGRVNWVSVHDVARFAAACVEGPAHRAVVPIGGPQGLTLLEVLNIYREEGATINRIDFVPDDALKARLEGARTPEDESRAAMALATARGYEVDPSLAAHLRSWSLTSVRDYAHRQLHTS